ncbi:hypothetical protein [Indiicoccus explosivorum]|uniref:hypothetical protein n=1 Tax=Indiicoccus explosivorum TaxID=1917864 RepID=UPI000B451AC2|nr:hypothetical protein [Indiicoccus explosivorum]
MRIIKLQSKKKSSVEQIVDILLEKGVNAERCKRPLLAAERAMDSGRQPVLLRKQQENTTGLT